VLGSASARTTVLTAKDVEGDVAVQDEDASNW
jgi:hypothetical protein